MTYNHGREQGSIDYGTHKTTIKYPHFAFLTALSILTCILNLFQPVSAILTTCYDPSRNLRQDDVPCYPDAINSFCCPQDWVCTNASVCIAGPKVTLNPGDPEQFEGTCTDITWNSPECPSFCRTGNLSANAVNGLWDCSGGNWCCSAYSGDTTCCKQDEGVFYLGDFVNVTTIGGAVGPGSSTSSALSSTTSSSTFTTTTSTSTSTSASVPASASTSASAASSASSPSDSSGASLGDGAKAGIGVGVAVGVIALVAIGYFMWRQRKLTLNLREQVQLLAGRGNEVPKDPRLEYSGVPPYHDHERYELGRFRGETAELPVENGRMSGR